MTTATASAVLLLCAAFLHSFSYMCRKLPPSRRPRLYPHHITLQVLLDIAWILFALAGAWLAFYLSTWLGIAAVAIYFILLPFVFQPSLARLMGFANLQGYLEATRKK